MVTTYKAGDKCPHCGAKLANEHEVGEDRLVCTQCSRTYNENPPLAVKVRGGIHVGRRVKYG
jgi:ribosomal protein S27AE